MREAIDSALGQDYPNIEIIVVNDGSNDNGETDAIARSYGDKIVYIVKENGGCASALNAGLAAMKGEYFSWLSHDDKYKPNKISHQISLLERLDNKKTIIFGGYELINAESKVTGSVRPDAVLTCDRLNIPMLPLLRGLIHGCSLIIAKEHFDAVGRFDESLPSTQDYALWFEMFRVAPLHFDSEILLQSRVHAEQGTHRISKHVEECNALWAGFLTRLTEAEMTAMSGSAYHFLMETAEFLENTPYKDAARLAREMASTARDEIVVSVVIPFQNRISWTIEAIQSVQAQTHQKFEIILIDDGSTEDVSRVAELVSSDARIRYVRQEQSGPAKARNLGVGLAVGAYVAFLDSDDLFIPSKLARQLQFMLDRRCVFSHSSYERISLDGEILQKCPSGSFSGQVFPAIIAGCTIAMPTVMARTDVLKLNPFPENYDIAEDVCLWIKLAGQYEVGGIDEVLSRVRIGPETAALNRRKQLEGYINIAQYCIRDPYLAQFEREIRSLLSSASSLLSPAAGASKQLNVAPMAPRRAVRPVLASLSKVLSSIRTHGLLVTLHRVRQRVGW